MQHCAAVMGYLPRLIPLTAGGSPGNANPAHFLLVGERGAGARSRVFSTPYKPVPTPSLNHSTASPTFLSLITSST